MQDVLPTTAQHYDVATADFENYASQGHSWARRIRQLQSHSDRRLVRSETVRDVMAATRCAMFVIQTCSLRTTSSLEHGSCGWYWWLNGSHCTNDSSFSPSQSTFHFSSRRSSSARCGILSMLTAGSCSAAHGNSIATRYKETCSLFLKADDRKILELLVLLFCGFVELIRRTTMMCAHVADCTLTLVPRFPCRVQYLMESC